MRLVNQFGYGMTFSYSTTYRLPKNILSSKVTL